MVFCVMEELPSPRKLGGAAIRLIGAVVTVSACHLCDGGLFLTPELAIGP
jgi:hypothetical protein